MLDVILSLLYIPADYDSVIPESIRRTSPVSMIVKITTNHAGMNTAAVGTSPDTIIKEMAMPLRTRFELLDEKGFRMVLSSYRLAKNTRDEVMGVRDAVYIDRLKERVFLPPVLLTKEIRQTNRSLKNWVALDCSGYTVLMVAKSPYKPGKLVLLTGDDGLEPILCLISCRYVLAVPPALEALLTTVVGTQRRHVIEVADVDDDVRLDVVDKPTQPVVPLVIILWVGVRVWNNQMGRDGFPFLGLGFSGLLLISTFWIGPPVHRSVVMAKATAWSAVYPISIAAWAISAPVPIAVGAWAGIGTIRSPNHQAVPSALIPMPENSPIFLGRVVVPSSQ